MPAPVGRSGHRAREFSIFLLAIVCMQAARAAVINSISPQRGGLLGGTQMTIMGSGFSRDGIAVRPLLA